MAFELDLKDKKLLLELDLDAKAAPKELAKKVGISGQAVLYRIKRLEENGILTGYKAIINFSRLGYTSFSVFCRLENSDEKKTAQIIEYLQSLGGVYWIGICGGRFDISFGLMCKSVFEFNRLYYDFKNLYSSHLSETAVAIRSELRQFTRNYLISDERMRLKPSLFFGKEPQLFEIDSLDSDIMSAIAPNCRRPITEIASLLGKPAATVAFRIKKLEQEGIIQGYDTVVKVQKYGVQSYRLLLTIDSMDEKERNRLFLYCQQNPTVWLAAETVGAWNFEIVYEVESHERLERELLSLKKIFGGMISKIEVLVMFEEDRYLRMWNVKKINYNSKSK